MCRCLGETIFLVPAPGFDGAHGPCFSWLQQWLKLCCAAHCSHAVVVEFTINDARLDIDNPRFTSPERRTFEQLLRWLLLMDNRPAVMLLQVYPWFQASGDGVIKGLFYKEPEAQFTTLAHVRSHGASPANVCVMQLQSHFSLIVYLAAPRGVGMRAITQLLAILSVHIISSCSTTT